MSKYKTLVKILDELIKEAPIEYKRYYSDRVGKKNEAELIVTNPQIINGGQTAFTLSRIYEECTKSALPLTIFDGREVLQ